MSWAPIFSWKRPSTAFRTVTTWTRPGRVPNGVSVMPRPASVVEDSEPMFFWPSPVSSTHRRSVPPPPPSIVSRPTISLSVPSEFGASVPTLMKSVPSPVETRCVPIVSEPSPRTVVTLSVVLM